MTECRQLFWVVSNLSALTQEQQLFLCVAFPVQEQKQEQRCKLLGWPGAACPTDIPPELGLPSSHGIRALLPEQFLCFPPAALIAVAPGWAAVSWLHNLSCFHSLTWANKSTKPSLRGLFPICWKQQAMQWSLPRFYGHSFVVDIAVSGVQGVQLLFPRTGNYRLLLGFFCQLLTISRVDVATLIDNTRWWAHCYRQDGICFTIYLDICKKARKKQTCIFKKLTHHSKVFLML